MRPAHPQDFDSRAVVGNVADGCPRLGLLACLPTPSLSGLMFLVIGLAALGYVVKSVATELRYAFDGTITDGVVVSKRQVHMRTGTATSITIQFTATGGETVVDEEEVGNWYWPVLADGTPVRVRYLRSDPHTNRLAEEWIWTEVPWLVPLALVGLGTVGLPAWLFWRCLRLLREGVAAEGTVSEVARESDRSTRYVIRYRFQDDRGQTHVGASDDHSRREAEAWHVGDVGDVLYDPRSPRFNRWVGTRRVKPGRVATGSAPEADLSDLR